MYQQENFQIMLPSIREMAAGSYLGENCLKLIAFTYDNNFSYNYDKLKEHSSCMERLQFSFLSGEQEPVFVFVLYSNDLCH